MIRRRMFYKLSEAPESPEPPKPVPPPKAVSTSVPGNVPARPVQVAVPVPVPTDPGSIEIPPLPPEELPRSELEKPKKLTPKQRAKEILKATASRKKHLQKILKDYYGVAAALGIKNDTKGSIISPRMLS